MHHGKEYLSELCLNGYISMKLLFSTLLIKSNHPLVKRKKKIFQIKKDFVTCSKFIINELGRYSNRSDNVLF